MSEEEKVKEFINMMTAITEVAAAGEEMEINQARFRAACKPGVILKLLNVCTIIQDIYMIAEFCSCDVGYSGSCGCGNAVEREAYDAFEVIASAYDELIEAGVFVKKKEF